jgi:hypothetical protein
MFLILCAVALVLSVPLTGGDLRRLSTVRLRWLPLLWAALALQLIATVIPFGLPDWALSSLHTASYVLVGAMVLANRRLPGILILWVGASLNLLAIAVNGGTLPARASALREAGIHPKAGFDNSGVVSHPHLAWLGDWWATPSWLPLRNVISVGDLVILAGAAVLLHVTCRSRDRSRNLLDAAPLPT